MDISLSADPESKISRKRGSWIYLLEFNVKSIDAAQISNVVNGGPILVPIGEVLLTLTSVLHSLRPQPCENGSSFCTTRSDLQFADDRTFTMAAMGANQFNSVKDQEAFINWYVIISYGSTVTGATIVVYTEDNVSWALGFGLSAVANIVGLAVFFLGSHYYHQIKLQGSPFTNLARVIIAAIRKRKVPLSSKIEDYYCGHKAVQIEVLAPTKSLSFKDRRRNPIGWLHCKTMEPLFNTESGGPQNLLEDFPLLSSAIFLSTPIAVLSSLTILQALTMDRHLGPHFKIPAGSMIVFILASTASKRLKVAQTHHLVNQTGCVVPMSVFRLVLQLAVIGFGEAFHYPGQVTLYYQEFPKSLRSTATAMISLIMGIAYYVSTAFVDLLQKITAWLPDNINKGRLDYVYWMFPLLGALNFGYFLIRTKFYK
ncbi:hypothetical protein P3X46_000264 [Hevea brasiliensis]|uniref:Amino acid transporter transmembrane domain-containing protein n=1 Tax=Hevea brasiliensis TaxID=3981 RepID=A0ABQ9N916_HEVBR|nr:hypothetical protein P3X46_000264 [Hevea brasiliensis]